MAAYSWTRLWNIGALSFASTPLKLLRRNGIAKRCCATVAAESNESPSNIRKAILEQDDYFNLRSLVTVESLFNARVHLGHYEGAMHPEMEKYIYGSRSKQHVIDLNKTVEHFHLALNVLAHVVYRKGKILLVSANPRYERLVQQTAREASEYFSTGYWRKGSLTNAQKLLGSQFALPDLIIFLTMSDFLCDDAPIIEAAMCGIPSIGITDSNCDPTLLTYRIPGNDDSPSSVELYCKTFKDTILKAKAKRTDDQKSLTT